MQKWKPSAILVMALYAPAVIAADITPLKPENVSPENSNAAIRYTTLSQLAKSAGFFSDVPNGEVMVTRLNDRMLEIARNASLDATDDELLDRMKAVFADYEKLAADGSTLEKGEMMKADFQVCMDRVSELFGDNLLPEE